MKYLEKAVRLDGQINTDPSIKCKKDGKNFRWKVRCSYCRFLRTLWSIMNEKKIKFVDLFAGIGGFHKGLDDAGGFESVWANEWDRYASSVYRYNYPNTPLETGDICTIEASTIPDHDLLCGGFPCQAFSVAGKRKGLEEARGTLFYEIARIAECKKPSLLLLENVKGLLSHDKGRTFQTILEVLGSIGYRLEWQVLNSKWFGVPQKRERVLIVGHLGTQPTRTIFPFTEISGFANSPPKETQGEGERIRLQDTSIAGTLSARYAKDGSENLIQVGSLYASNADAGRVYDPRGIAKTISSLGGGLGAKTGLYEVRPTLTPSRVNKRQNGRRFKENGEDMFTLTGQDVHGVRIDTPNEKRIRRLMPIECERLQGFPDDWTLTGTNAKGKTIKISDTQRYKQCGNAISVPVVCYIGEKIKTLI
jgi:DNA (cytosine-5)-methyltransferase 1